MLFKKFLGRWGGVIEDNYEEFIENIAALVEDNLLNYKALENAVNEDSFKKLLYSSAETFFNKTLPQKTGDAALCDIPGSEKSAAGLIELLKDCESELFTLINANILQHKKFIDLISGEQYAVFINETVKRLFLTQKTLDFDLEAILYSFCEKKYITDFINEEEIKIIAHNIFYFAKDFSNLLKKTEYSGCFFETFLESKLFFSFAREAGEKIKNLPFSSFELKNKENFFELAARNAANTALSAARAPFGEKFIKEAAEAILEKMKTIDQNPASFFYLEKESGIEEAVFDILEEARSVLKENREEVEDLINLAIDEELQKTAWGSVLKSVKDIFGYSSPKGKSAAVKIEEAVTASYAKVCNRVKQKTDFFFNKQTIGSAIGSLIEKENINAEIVYNFICAYLENLQEKKEILPKSLLDKKPGDFINTDFVYIQKKGLYFAYNFIVKENRFAPLSEKNWTSFAEKKVSSFLEKRGDLTALSFINPRGAFIRADEKKTVNFFLSMQKTVLSLGLGGFFYKIKTPLINWNSIWEKNKNTKINLYLEKLKNKHIFAKTAEGALFIINKNLKKLLYGNVSALVKWKLSSHTPAEINVLAQGFIGGEMGPINLLGGFLGALCGILSACAFALFDPEGGSGILRLPLYCVIFAAMGVFTNAIAVRMLFRPYKKFIFNTPPFIGVVALRKKDFAKNTASFVSQSAVSEGALDFAFKLNMEKMRKKYISILEDPENTRQALIYNDIILNYSFNNGKKINYFLAQSLKDYALKNSAALSSYIYNSIQRSKKQNKNYPVLIHSAINGFLDLASSGGGGDFIWEKIRSKSSSAVLNKIDFVIKTKAQNYSASFIENLNSGAIINFILLKKSFFYNAASIPLKETAAYPFINKLPVKTAAFICGGKPASFLEDFFFRALKSRFSGEASVKDAVFFVENSVLGGKTGAVADKLTGFLFEAVQKELKAERSAICETVLGGMNFASRAAAGSKVPAIVDLIIDEKLPVFFLNKRKSFSAAVERALYGKKISSLGFRKTKDIKTQSEKAISRVLDNEALKKTTAEFLYIFITRILEKDAKTLLKKTGVKNIEDLIHIINPLLTELLIVLKEKREDKDFLNDLSAILFEAIKEIFKDVKLGDLASNLNVKEIINRFFNILKNDAQTVDLAAETIFVYLSAINENGALLDENFIKNNIQNFIESVIKNDFSKIEGLLEELIESFLKRAFFRLTEETKKKIIFDYLFDAFTAAAGSNMEGVNAAIDVRGIVEKEINEMHPAKIEETFYKFAGSYFKKIIFYGWIGAAGGVAAFISRFF